MIDNEVALLKKENAKQSKELRDEDVEVIKSIMKSMSIFRVNSYDAQVIQRDLIGMAQELMLRDSSLKEDIGEDVKGFANEIINNSNGPCKKEILLNFLLKLSGYFFVWFTSLSIGAYSGLTWMVHPSIFLFYFGAVVLSFIVEGLITPIFCTERGFKKNLQSLISLLLLGGLSIIIFKLYDNQHTSEVKAIYIIVISGLMYLITKYFNSRNINRLARGKRNFIEDLR